MLNFFTIMKIILGMLPMLRELVIILEALLPATGSGAQRLALLKAIIEKAIDVSDDVTTPFARLWPLVEKVVSVLVPMLTKKTSPEIELVPIIEKSTYADTGKPA